MSAAGENTRIVTTDHTPDTRIPIAAGDRVVFKHPAIGLLGVALFTVCLAPIAGPWMIGRGIDGSAAPIALRLAGWALLLIPLIAIYWLFRVRTVVDGRGIRSVRFAGSTALAWDEVTGLRLDKGGAVYAAHTTGSDVRLPAVTISQLPRVSAASGGRVPDIQGD